ncbi:MAG: hypothetical protein ACYCWW_15305 [Deltaproteobacteria bacterium]
MPKAIRLAVALTAIACGAACGGAPCSQFCQKIIQCYQSANNGNCNGDQATCVERCQEADSIDHTGDFAAMASCVANPNLSCGDLPPNGTHCPGAQMNFDDTCH